MRTGNNLTELDQFWAVQDWANLLVVYPIPMMEAVTRPRQLKGGGPVFG